ncbi:MAG: hypothetical protein M1355_02105 [Patescibacteria group bacterium]|nr:hypothetical protein [Patescibacteria group bacterium]
MTKIISREKTHVMVAGASGALGRAVVKALAKDERYKLAPFTIGTAYRAAEIEGLRFEVFQQPGHLGALNPDVEGKISEYSGRLVVVDCTKLPQWDSANLFSFTCHVPLILMGSEGRGDPQVDKKIRLVTEASILRVANAAGPVAAVIGAFEHIAETYSGAFAGMKGSLQESHQASKKGTPGTATAIFEALTKLGADVPEIESIRDPGVQEDRLGVPREYLDGHGLHRIILEGNNVEIVVVTKVYGRDPYGEHLAEVILPNFIGYCLESNEPKLLDWPLPA